jgi:histidinol-phosphatase (PHP family)
MRNPEVFGQSGNGIPMAHLVDMHVHATSSPDASLPEEALAERAVAAGLGAVGFVAHVDFHPRDYCVGAFHADGYDEAFGRALETAGGSVKLLKGIETGEPHRFARQIALATAGHSYDFVLGALHWVGDRQILDPEPFQRGDPLELVEEYYRELLVIASTCDIDVLAHAGIFRRGMARAGLDTSFDETSLWPGLISDVMQALIRRGIALELNTSGLRRPELVTYPTPRVLSLYRSLGGTNATLGSDTHSDPWVFYGLAEGAALLRSAGFGYVTGFAGRKAFPAASLG